jgi:hypothetical protein
MMHDDQVHIDADSVRTLIDSQFPEYHHAPIERTNKEAILLCDAVGL